MDDSVSRKMHFDRNENNEQAAGNTWACYTSWQTSQAVLLLTLELPVGLSLCSSLSGLIFHNYFVSKASFPRWLTLACKAVICFEYVLNSQEISEAVSLL